MARYYFIWNGVNSSNMGILMREPAPIIKPEERIEHVTVPGRSGELTVTEGEDIYQSYIQTVHIAVHQKSQVHAVETWLRGDGYVTFSTQADRRQKARVIGAVTLEKKSRNLDWWEGDVQFYCNPLKETLVDEPDMEIDESGGDAFENPGDVVAKPLIQIRGSGLITVTCGGKTLTIDNCVDKWYIDSDAEWVTDKNGVPQEGVCSGDFPVFAKGMNTVLYTGNISKLIIRSRWRFL
jgi:phage-related protein